MIAIIPARKGSKGLPGKNMKNLDGKPLIAHTINAALKARHVEKVYVSTDCEHIYNLSLNMGCEESFLRPDHLAADDSLAIDNYLYTIAKLEKEQGLSVNSFVVLQPTSPLRNEKHIDEAIEMFQIKGADSVISFTEEAHPIYWNKTIDKNGIVGDIFSVNGLQNRQNYECTYYPNGAIYVFKTALIKSGNYYSGKTFGYIMDQESSVDIDTIEDFLFAEFKMERK